MASKWYNGGLAGILDHSIDLLADTIKVMPVTAAYTYDADHKFVSSASGSEVSGTGYTGGFGGSGRKALASKTVTQDDALDRGVFDAADMTWTGISVGTIAALVLIKEVTNDAASRLIAYLDPADLLTDGSNVNAVWAAAGLLYLAT